MLLVVRPKIIHQDSSLEMISTIEQNNASILGVVINEVIGKHNQTDSLSDRKDYITETQKHYQ